MGDLGKNQVTKEEFITHEFDPFKDQTTTKLNNPTHFMAGDFAHYLMNLERLQNASEDGFDVVRIGISGFTLMMSHDWVINNRGQMQITEIIFNCDQENIVCEEQWDNTPDVDGPFGVDDDKYRAVNECLVLLESSEQLLKIASAKQLEMRVSTKGGYVDLSDAEEKIFQDMAKLFYNQVYDKDMFKDELDDAKKKSLEFQEASEKDEGGGCFIATAVYGTYTHPDLTVLRGFRDNSLSKTPVGKAFIAAYYKYGPTIANVVKDSYLMRCVFSVPVKGMVYLVKKTKSDKGSVFKPKN